MSYSVVDTVSVIREFFLAGTSPVVGTLSMDLADVGMIIDLADDAVGLPGGVSPIKIGDEIILVGGSGDALGVELKGRGAFGTIAAAHLTGAEVTRVLLPQAIGGPRAYFSKAPEGSGPAGFKNLTPAIVFNIVGSWREPGTLAIRYPRVQVRCFGGKDSSRYLDPLFPQIIQRLVIEKSDDLEAPLDLASGTVVSSSVDGEGNSLWDDTVEPSWPYSLVFLNMEIRKG